ncbi:hypothetical protein NA57DRAFT_68918 [Rhizodiscina lignyota]|uniref:WW domain-containing protein n=1 Tax=Rhizodiscina lignyota TaxID=1504668 RepID=A0A9P4I5K2_9PEZI|nr:hypothetical protein NA57DRAFT_68918 [Rhizodiscina lignyota]
MIPYEYSSLRNEEIRILKLLPGGLDDPIRMTIEHAPLIIPNKTKEPTKRISQEQLQSTLPSDWKVYIAQDGRYIFRCWSPYMTSWTHPDLDLDKSCYEGYEHDPDPGFVPNFEALSYVWGPFDGEEAAIIERASSMNCKAVQTMKIRKNLASALRHLRRESSIRNLWIDALCINQADVPERNRQVPRMRHIYSLARRVIVWLGEESPDSSHALSTMEFLGGQGEPSNDGWHLPSPGCREPLCRLWTVQEILLANRFAIVQCGSANMLITNRGIGGQLRKCLNDLRIMLDLQTAPDAANTLTLGRVRDNTDPRDKIYGLLSILPQHFSRLIKPDYSSTTAETYQSAFLLFSNFHCRLDLLPHCGGNAANPEIPTWVPDWSVKRQWSIHNQDQFASGMSSSQMRYISPSVLEIVGLRAATVSEDSEGIPGSADYASQHSTPFEPQRLDSTQYIAGGSLFDAYVHTVHESGLRERYPLLAHLPTLQDASSELAKRRSLSDLGIGWRAFLKTTEGYIGTGPPIVRQGDHVVCVLGCSRLIILRPTSAKPSNSTQFHVIGDCFLHGLQDATALLGSLPRNYTLQMQKDNHSLIPRPVFMNHENGSLQVDDPRLGPIPADWERLPSQRTSIDLHFFARFENKATGELLNSDPRMLPEALEARGVHLQTFQLV